MNINSIARSTGAQWLNRGIAVVGTLLIAGAVALGLANSASMLVVPATAPASSASPAHRRFAAFKQAQAERKMDAAMESVIAPTVSERFAELKQRQAELRDTTIAPLSTRGQNRFAELKQRQADLRDATYVPALVHATGRERFAELKQRQAELRDTTSVPAHAESGWNRFMALKERQVEAKDTTMTPVRAARTSPYQRFVEFKERQAEAKR